MKYIAAFVSMLLLALSVGSSQPTPAFEVASVKTFELPRGAVAFGAGTNSPSAVQISGNRVTVRGTLMALTMAAYNLRDSQVTGAPGWTDNLGRQQLFDIAARTPGESTPTLDQVRPMLQVLLADRFQLKFHREGKELLVYELVVGKNGPKLKESVTDGKPAGEPLTISGSNIRANYVNKSIADLIAIIHRQVDRPIVDKTGLTGRYDFILEYTVNNPEVAPVNSPDADRSIFSALQEQLGLKLVAAKDSTEIFVIEHAERPSEN